MPLWNNLIEIIGRLLYVPLDMFVAAFTSFFGFHFNDRADWLPVSLTLASLQVLFICRLKCRRWPVAGLLAFAFSLVISCLAPVFMYFACWYWWHGNNGASPASLPHAARFLVNLLVGEDKHLMGRRDICAYCYGWMGWTVNTCVLFFVLGGKQMTKRQRIGALLLFLLPWVGYELFFNSPFGCLTW